VPQVSILRPGKATMHRRQSSWVTPSSRVSR